MLVSLPLTPNDDVDVPWTKPFRWLCTDDTVNDRSMGDSFLSWMFLLLRCTTTILDPEQFIQRPVPLTVPCSEVLLKGINSKKA